MIKVYKINKYCIFYKFMDCPVTTNVFLFSIL